MTGGFDRGFIKVKRDESIDMLLTYLSSKVPARPPVSTIVKVFKVK
jgi:hypothetical protein